MNKVVLIGRLTRDPDIRYTQGEYAICIARYTLAVDRRFKREGEQNADFISCVAFGKSGEFVEKYLHKGTKIAITGRIQTGSYEKDGQKVYTTDVVVEEHEFAESKASSSGSAGSSSPAAGTGRSQPATGQTGYDGFMNIPDGIDEELPFN